VVRPVIRHSGAGLNVVAEKAEANKCDLCFHRESGPACMEVCPGQLPDKGAEPHPLHFTANADLHPVHALTYQASAVRRRFSI
ncbi:hypothetical protein LUD23_30210, partial [Klebsiella pneumoniae]|nr:hypothetical protein [Klebsiella pneumoniae]